MAIDATISLLWPGGQQIPARPTPPTDLIADLNLSQLINALSLTRAHRDFVTHLLLAFVQDPDVIRYRQDVLDDLQRAPDLVDHLESMLETISSLQSYMLSPQWQENRLQYVAWRLSELEAYVECVVELNQALDAAGDAIRSDGLRQLQATVRETIHESTFQSLQTELPALIQRIRGIGSITIGINLDSEMRPTSAILLSINTQTFNEATLFSRLFGGDDDSTGAGQLHDARKVNFGGERRFTVELRDRRSPFMPALFRDLSDLMDETCKPIEQALKRYMNISSQFLLALESEIAFYVAAVRLIDTLKGTGLPLTRPDILDSEARVSQLVDVYNINLALQREKSSNKGAIITNDAVLDDAGRIFVLTGPNQGGKTTYTRAVGLSQVMFQVGLPVPAREAAMSPVDGIYTHFATEERPELETGRLGEEAGRLSTIFDHATRNSLILLNETLASTSAAESLFLARDVVRAIRVLGARAIFATHLHDLAADCDEMNAETAGDSVIVSMVSLVEIEENPDGDQIRRTYRIVPSPPMRKSYAIELAARYGISFEQITQTLRQRRVINDGE